MRISDWSSDVCSSDLQANNRRDSLLPTDTRLLQVPLHARPQLGQRAAEPSAPVELVRFLPGAEIGMIAILFTALLVIPDRLDMSSGIGAEPRSLISRWPSNTVKAIHRSDEHTSELQSLMRTSSA